MFLVIKKVVMRPHVDLGVHVQQHVILQAHRPEIVLILFVVQQKNKDHAQDPVCILIHCQKIIDSKSTSTLYREHSHTKRQRHKNAGVEGQMPL